MSEEAQVLKQTLDWLIPMMKPILHEGSTWVSEHGQCVRNSSHVASVERHWNGKEYDDTHYLCFSCTLVVKHCKLMERSCVFEGMSK